ncbi:MAG: glutathione S-transferase family protein [Pseudomonadales bacterium]|nr:glutathione S-transferase family protein [Pseudomonadales bacterium]
MKNAELTLYAYNIRTRAERILWGLNELNFQYNVVRLDPFKGDTNTKEFLELNPNKKVPVLVHQDRVYTESLAILEYLDELSSEKNIIPTESQEKYRFRNLIYYLNSEIEPHLWIADQCTRLKRIYHWPEGTLDEALQRVEKSIPTVFSIVVENEFAIGPSFSIADIYAHHVITWARSYNISIPTDVALYLEKLENRPSFPAEMKND